MVGADSAPVVQDSCSQLAADEPLAGTAPYARAWIAIEQPGSWGRDALRSNALPYGVGPVLAERAKAADAGVLLIRHPDRPRHLSDSDPRIVWVAQLESNTLKKLAISDCRELLDWDLAALAHGDFLSACTTNDEQPDHVSADRPLALVCCHAARDACCAIHGRALYDALLARTSREATRNIWQSSHLGGHRFAPTMLVLPLGMVYGRMNVQEAQGAIVAAARSRIRLGHCRGRTHLPPAVQAADLHLRTALHCENPEDLTYTVGAPSEHCADVTAQHRDGRIWSMRVEAQENGLVRPASCGAEPEVAPFWDVTIR